jgi:hypothetical protein
MGWGEVLAGGVYVCWLVCLYLDYRYDYWMRKGIRRMYESRTERRQGMVDVNVPWEDNWGEKNPLPPEPYGQTQRVGGRISLRTKKKEFVERR